MTWLYSSIAVSTTTWLYQELPKVLPPEEFNRRINEIISILNKIKSWGMTLSPNDLAELRDAIYNAIYDLATVAEVFENFDFVDAKLGIASDVLYDVQVLLNEIDRQLEGSVRIGRNIISSPAYDYDRIVYTEKMKSAFEKIRRTMEKHFKRRVGFYLPGRPVNSLIDLPATISDIANIIHVLTEVVVPPTMERYRKVYYERDADPWIVDLAKKWSDNVEKFMEEGLYAREDYEPLSALVTDKRASFRVGSAEGHATHIEVVNDDVRVRYYDLDEDVNEIFNQVLSRLCNCSKLDDGVECFCKKRDDVKDALSKLLALVTSMDFRIRDYGFEKVKEHTEKTVFGG